jgi:DNA-binding transcriptional LysR family regulator
MSRLEQITAFVTIIEANGFAAAARKLGISTAAVSRQMNKLEASLQVKLLRRTTRQIALTDIGNHYYNQVVKTLEELKAAESLIQNSHDVCKGELHIMSNRYFAFHALLPRLPEFTKANPQLHINLELSERFPYLSKEKLDLIFGISMPYMPELIQKKVATTSYTLCASPTYLKQHGMPVKPSDLKRHAFITHSKREFSNEITFKNDKKITVKPLLALNDSRAMCECAILGMGIVKLHAYVVADAIQKGLLVEILKDFQANEQTIYLYYQQSHFVQPKIRRFIDFFVPQ